jgi:hypothetical protein
MADKPELPGFHTRFCQILRRMETALWLPAI